MTLLAACIFVERLDDLSARCEAGWAGGADAIELRIDSYEGDLAALNQFIRAARDRTWIITCRSQEEGGFFRGDLMERVSRLIAVARGTNAFVDFEFADWQRSANIRQKVLLAASGTDGAHRLILSAHQFTGSLTNATEKIREILGAGRSLSTCLSEPSGARSLPLYQGGIDEGSRLVGKVAYLGRDAADSFVAMDALREHGPSGVAICMGDYGIWTRVVAKKFSAFATYATIDSDSPAAPGQPTLGKFVDQCRWAAINANTKIFGLIGDPVAHSLSPALFNHWFERHGVDAIYLPFRVEDAECGLAKFLDECRARPWLDLGGFSVTLPHKENAFDGVRAGADSLTRRIGATNTIVFDDDAVRAYNTDAHAAFDSLLEALRITRDEVSGMRVDVLGAGGAARAIVVPLRDFGASVTVYARNPERLERIARDLPCVTRSWADRIHRDSDVLINTTPFGMWPDVDESPMPGDCLGSCRLVFDMIYRPLETRLLREAGAAGCGTLNGLDMFVRQAAMQFELWVGESVDRVEAAAFLQDQLRIAEGNAPRKLGGLRDGAAQSTIGNRQSAIALIGMRGSGKTTVGRELARLLKVPHVDTDDLVVAEAGQTIAQIFATEDESGFRAREVRAVRAAVSRIPAVISVGGGAILDPANLAALREVATVVWLGAPPEVLLPRIRACSSTVTSRPPLTLLNELDELREVLSRREARYRDAANLIVNTEGRMPVEIAHEIHKNLTVGLTFARKTDAGSP